MINLAESEPAHSLPEPATRPSQSTLSILKKLSGSMSQPTLAVLSTVDPRIGACATVAYHSWTFLHSYFTAKLTGEKHRQDAQQPSPTASIKP